MKAIVLHSTPDHKAMILPTASLRALVLKVLIRRGWKYFVTFKDVNGFGIQASFRATWQDDKSPVYHNR